MIFFVLIFLTGASVGSFLELTAMRTTAGGSILRPRSHCDACHHVLEPPDLIPIASYLLLRGRCRHCGARFSPMSTITELCTGMLFVLFVERFGLTPYTVWLLLVLCLLFIMARIDLATGEVYDRHLYLLAGFCILHGIFWLRPLTAPVPGLLLWLLFSVLVKDRMGDGDKILIALMFLLYPPSLQLRFFLYSVWAAAIVSVILLLRGASRKTEIPFVPFLLIGFVFVQVLHGGTA